MFGEPTFTESRALQLPILQKDCLGVQFMGISRATALPYHVRTEGLHGYQVTLVKIYNKPMIQNSEIKISN